MLKRPVYTTSLRYRFVQWLLWILFGKRNMYICPWKHTAVGTGAFMFFQNKMLLGLRAAHTPEGGKYGIIGGYVDFDKNESPTEALVREAREEAGLELDLIPFTMESIFHIRDKHQILIPGEFDDFSRIDILFIYHLTQKDVDMLSDSDEMTGWDFYTLEEAAELYNQGRLACDIDVLADAFKAAQATS